MKILASCRVVLLGMLLSSVALEARAQQILLEPVQAGDLVLFRDLTDDKVYYYLSDKPQLAVGPDGKPEFSLLRWVENVRTGGGEAEAREGEGGGIVHALVTLAVTPEQIQQAQAALQQQRPGGRIRGPVMYRQGTFGLVSSFKDKTGGLVEQVVGIGKAPSVSNEKAAISIQLTKRGAQVLWESLQTPTPDISFTFEMELEGFRPPARAILEADFSQIYTHKQFAAGFASTHLAAEVETAFDDLRRSGGIKLTEIGDDAELKELIATAYSKISDVMFETAPDILKPAAGLGPGQEAQTQRADSMMDRATAFLAASRASAGPPTGPGRPDPKPSPAGGPVTSDADAKAADAKAKAAEEKASGLGLEVSKLEKQIVEAEGAQIKLDQQAAADKTENDKRQAEAQKEGAGQPAKDAAKASADKLAASNQKREQGALVVAGFKKELAAKKPAALEAQTEAARLRTEARKMAEGAGKGTTDTPKTEAAKGGKDNRPTWAALASFKMKSIRQSGKMRWDLNKYTESTRILRFDGNIGDVRKYRDHFREVNLSSPLYQQREVVVYVDGANLSDFGQYVNFVTVRLHKRHAGGEVTDDEVLIDRNNFNSAGNRFKLLYGWKGDNERGRWMEYEYQTVWSLFGGKTVETPMQKATAQAIPVTAPYARRIVELRGDTAELARAEVRSVSVKLFYDLGGTTRVKQGSLDVSRPQASQIEFMTLPETTDYEYEITWRLRGNRTLTSGRQKGSDPFVDVGDVPLG